MPAEAAQSPESRAAEARAVRPESARVRAHATREARRLRDYQPRVSSSCSGGRSAALIENIASPSPAETRARISGSL